MKHDPDSVRRARESRKNQTSAEEKLWSLLRNRRLIARKFRRQHPIGPWVADFACPAIKLAIEVDGPSHDTEDQQAWDEMKTEYPWAPGYYSTLFEDPDGIRIEGLFIPGAGNLDRIKDAPLTPVP